MLIHTKIVKYHTRKNNLFVLDKNNIVDLVFELDWQVQMNADARSFDIVYECIVSHSANKWNFVPFTGHSIANMVLGPVSNALKVISLTAHQ
jgi:hypothetical protein